MAHWDPRRDMQDLSGKVAIVTGGNTGIGKELVRQLALRKACVYMASRTRSRALTAIEDLKTECQDIAKLDNVRFLQLDLCSLEACKRAATEFLQKETRLDILINNAGIAATPYELTADGVELQFQSNYLGHYAFTRLLIPLLVQSSKDPTASVRIVQVTSNGHASAAKDVAFDSLENVNRKSYDPWQRYGQSKLATILFAKELAHRLHDERIFSNATHPGAVRSELKRGTLQSYPYLKPVFWVAERLFFTSPYKGTITPLYAACAPEIERKQIRGQYLVPFAKIAKPSAQSQDEKLARDLWDLSEHVVEEKIGTL